MGPPVGDAPLRASSIPLREKPEGVSERESLSAEILNRKPPFCLER